MLLVRIKRKVLIPSVFFLVPTSLIIIYSNTDFKIFFYLFLSKNAPKKNAKKKNATLDLHMAVTSTHQ